MDDSSMPLDLSTSPEKNKVGLQNTSPANTTPIQADDVSVPLNLTKSVIVPQHSETPGECVRNVSVIRQISDFKAREPHKTSTSVITALSTASQSQAIQDPQTEENISNTLSTAHDVSHRSLKTSDEVIAEQHKEHVPQNMPEDLPASDAAPFSVKSISESGVNLNVPKEILPPIQSESQSGKIGILKTTLPSQSAEHEMTIGTTVTCSTGEHSKQNSEKEKICSSDHADSKVGHSYSEVSEKKYGAQVLETEAPVHSSECGENKDGESHSDVGTDKVESKCGDVIAEDLALQKTEMKGYSMTLDKVSENKNNESESENLNTSKETELKSKVEKEGRDIIGNDMETNSGPDIGLMEKNRDSNVSQDNEVRRPCSSALSSDPDAQKDTGSEVMKTESQANNDAEKRHEAFDNQVTKEGANSTLVEKAQDETAEEDNIIKDCVGKEEEVVKEARMEEESIDVDEVTPTDDVEMVELDKDQLENNKPEQQKIDIALDDNAVCAEDIMVKPAVTGLGEHIELKSNEDSKESVPGQKKKKVGGLAEVEEEPESHFVTAEKLFEYQWPQERGGEYYMLQEQVSRYLGVLSFKRKHPDLQRRQVEIQERIFLLEKGVVSETMCDLGLTALKSEEVCDLMMKDYSERYQEYAVVLQERERKKKKVPTATLR